MEKYVYLLEDDIDIAYIIQFLLEDEGMKVDVFSSIKSLNTAINKHIPDLFIFDVNLPDGNGIQLCNAIKADSKFKGTPILLISAHNTAFKTSKHCEADAYISKPFDLDNLLETVGLLIKGNLSS